MLLQHGRHAGDSRRLDAFRVDARQRSLARNDQRLDLHQYASGAFPGSRNRGPRGRAALAPDQKHGLGIRQFSQAAFGHRKQPHLVGRSEAVLGRSQETHIGFALLEHQHHIHGVLSGLGPRDDAILGHVRDEETCAAALAGTVRQFKRAVFDLIGGARNSPSLGGR